MAWDHLSINKPHLVYIILGGFTSLFMLCSSFIKERLYIGEATVATLCGIIFGPHAANLIDPGTWGTTDQITLEFSRIVLVVQCFAVGVELPKYYMEKHWRSVVFLLIPVMTFGWLVTSLFIWWMIPTLNWLESLCCAACVTATDPVLASSVVGKGKFAKRVPKHLRDILSAESGCNDGMAFPFIYLALYLIDFRPNANEVSFNWFVITILYECVFGAFYGFMIGYIGRHGIKLAEKHDLVDRESFLVFYFVLALFCAGSGSILGVDDLLVGFSAGVGFSNDGWFTQKTEESHVSNVIDLLLNLAYFVYLGTIIPWEMYNMPNMGITPWRLVVIALFVIFFRRIPIMLMLKPIIPDVKTWREALFAGHFGPIGVGAIFVAILARAELETETTTPLNFVPDDPTFINEKHYVLVYLIWPITTFLVISSIIVHGSSIAVFTLGKHINTLTLTMSYTQGISGDEGPGWLNRLPRITSTSRSQAKSTYSETSFDGDEGQDLPPGMLPPIGQAGNFLRRQKEEDNPSRQGSRNSSLVPRRRKKKWDDPRGPGGPISQDAIYPRRRSESVDQSPNKRNSDTLTPGNSSPENIDDEKNERDLGEVQHDPQMEHIMQRGSVDEKGDQHKSDADRHPDEKNRYQEGDDIIIENDDGDVLEVRNAETGKVLEKHEELEFEKQMSQIEEDNEHPTHAYANLRKKLGVWRHKDEVEGEESSSPKKGKAKAPQRKRGPALAYQFGNTIIVEDEDGEVVKTYEMPSNKQAQKAEKGGQAPLGEASTKRPQGPMHTDTLTGSIRQGLTRMGTWGIGGNKGTSSTPDKRATANADEEEDDRHIRFTLAGAGRRLTKEDFLKELQSLDPKARCEVVEKSDAPEEMKNLAKRDANKNIKGQNRLLGAKDTQAASGKGVAKGVGAQMARDRGADIDVDDDEDDRARRRAAHGALDLGRKNKPGSGAPIVGATTTTSSGKSDGSGANKAAKIRSNDAPESEAERRRREQALKGVDDVTPAQRGVPSADEGDEGGAGEVEETAAEKRRREAALTGGGEDDSEDDDTPRVPPPVASRRGIRFAESPERGRRGGRGA